MQEDRLFNNEDIDEVFDGIIGMGNIESQNDLLHFFKNFFKRENSDINENEIPTID